MLHAYAARLNMTENLENFLVETKQGLSFDERAITNCLCVKRCFFFIKQSQFPPTWLRCTGPCLHAKKNQVKHWSLTPCLHTKKRTLMTSRWSIDRQVPQLLGDHNTQCENNENDSLFGTIKLEVHIFMVTLTDKVTRMQVGIQ